MPFVFPRHDELLKSQRHLPAKDRQSRILLEFTTPIARRFAGEFQRIHLTRGMLAAGESSFYEAKVFQPHRAPRIKCPICNQPMDPLGPTESKCRNPDCRIPGENGLPSDRATAQYVFNRGPARGVVAVLTLPEFVIHRELRQAHGHEWVDETIDRALLILDRRYDQAVLAAVVRAANQICELYGWGLKS